MTEKLVLSYAKGITHSPSDLLCGDGELEECINLEVRNEELVPMEMPVILPFALSSGEKLLLVHNTKTDDKNYVTTTNGVIKIFKYENGVKTYYDFSLLCEGVKSIQYIGNSIVVYTSDSPYYILYKDGTYTLLGSKLPEVGISFDLSGEFVISDIFEFTTPELEYTSEGFQEAVCAALVPEVNKFIDEESVAKGKFIFPFFVRYALRMFDGTHTMHSAPILMLPSTNTAPFVSSYSDMRNFSGKPFEAQVGAIVAHIEATISSVVGSLSNWSDVITSVDIFVSRQFYTYDQNGVRFGNAAASGSKFVGKYSGTSTIWDGYAQMADKVTMKPGSGEYLHRWYIPSRSIEEVQSEIANNSLFYKYTSINIGEVVSGQSITLSGSLGSLEVGERLNDDYMTHDVFVPESSFVYNGRLNISNIKRKLYDGFPIQNMVPLVKYTPIDGFDYGLSFGTFDIYTHIKSPNGGSDIVVKSNGGASGALYGSYFFYPDTDAYKMTLVDEANSLYAEVLLTEHPMLNGAYAFIGFQAVGFTSGTPDVSVTTNEEIQPNKLYVSNVNNLFHFPLGGIYTVGSDRIIGLAAVTRPISQGQFGEFPLIVFCSDGNYAMRVDEQGYYESIAPVQEDIVLGSDKITPMENSILTITKKGIMLTAGGEMRKVANQMDGGVLNTTTLEGLSTSVPGLSTLVGNSSDTEGFLSYVYQSRMAFDYASNRILVYNPDKTYSYIYNLENDTASKIVVNNGARIITSVMDYPDVIVQDSEGVLYSLYSKEDVSTKSDRQYGMLLTRPIKMGAVLELKSVRQVMHITSNGGDGSFVKYLLYGSNDNVTYHKVSSRYGKPYKFYRIAIYTYLLPKESLSGSALTIETRRNHKLR